MTFEQWSEDYGLKAEPNYSAATEADCRAAYAAGQRAEREECAKLAERNRFSIKTPGHIAAAIRNRDGK